MSYNLSVISNFTLSLSLAGLRGEPASRGPRELIEWTAAQGYSAIQLDATMNGLRPRDLDRSARRGVASVLRRLGLSLSGLDLWIPPEHFSDPSRQQRAIDAVTSALVLAAELRDGSLPTVSVAFPRDAAAAKEAIREASAKQGVSIAGYGDVAVVAGDPIAIGFDPAAAMSAGLKVESEVARLAPALVSARLSDWSGSRRVRPGQGRLDLLGYGVSLEVSGYTRPLVVDLRDVDDAAGAAAAAREAWTSSSS